MTLLRAAFLCYLVAFWLVTWWIAGSLQEQYRILQLGGFFDWCFGFGCGVFVAWGRRRIA